MTKKDLIQVIEDMFITFDEDGLEPTTPCGMTGSEINTYWRLKVTHAVNEALSELEFLHELKRIIMEFLIADAQKGNEAILKAIMTERTLRTMLGMEGDNHGEQAQADLLDDH